VTEAARTIDVGEINIHATVGALGMLPGDPTVRLAPGRIERATLTPEGPAAIRVSWSPDDPNAQTADVRGWGDGAEWIVARADRLLGLADDVSDFDPVDERVKTVWQRNRHRRLMATSTLWPDLASFIVQQRVTTADAAGQWARLTAALGQPAPGPVDLMTPAEPAAIRSLRYDEFHPFGIERKRAEYLREAARIADRFAMAVDEPFDAVGSKLATVRGLGPWTLGMVATHTWGCADAVIVGDSGLPQIVTWFLAREEHGTDDRMLELLEPYRPHRARIIGLAMASGARPPRRRHRGHRHDIRRR